MDDVLEWSAIQSHILTGGNQLEARYPESSFIREDLPHHYLVNDKTWEQFARWSQRGLRSSLIVGAWNRPLFCGGWKESSPSDTAVYNLQTPSMFIDLRIPVARPRLLSSNGSLANCSLQELRILARQHIFAGYTLVDIVDGAPVCTRHHCIDWNYHPLFPRTRPNRWRVLVSPDGGSFKEYSVANDTFGQAIYMERWARMPGDGGGQHYFVMRALPSQQQDSGMVDRHDRGNAHGPRVVHGVTSGANHTRGSEASQPRRRDHVARDGEGTFNGDAMLVVVGRHFAFVEDRRRFPARSALDACKGPGGCANLVDAAHDAGDRAAMEDLLQIEGCYGIVPPYGTVQTGTQMDTLGASFEGSRAARVIDAGAGEGWIILASTHPWREGQPLLRPGDVQELVDQGVSIKNSANNCLMWRGRQWQVLECSLSWADVRAMLCMLRPAL